jgi:hypothetical protein
MIIETFSDTLTDLGTYTLDVAASDEQQAAISPNRSCMSTPLSRCPAYPSGPARPKRRP